MISGEPLAWGVVANVSREILVRQSGRKRPGTRHFVPGARVWVLAVGADGGEQRYVVGTRRNTGGRRLIRLVMDTEYLVNYRVKPIYSPAVYASMGQPMEFGEPRPYESREDAQESVDTWKWHRTRRPHLALTGRERLMHNADEDCEFCDGRDAFRIGAARDTNPYERPGRETPGTVDWWGTSYGMWRAGWVIEKNREHPSLIDDLGLRHVALARYRLRREAENLVRDAVGRTIAELEADRIGRDRIQFVAGDRQPRPLDGVVHAWIDADERVIRARAG
ncbi:hypothetical protein ACFY36_02160 [Actinoplanes sp. NPDC000266]